MHKQMIVNEIVVNYLDSVKGEMSYNEILCQLLGLEYKRKSKKLPTTEAIESLETGQSIYMTLGNERAVNSVKVVIGREKRRHGKQFVIGNYDATKQGWP